MVAGLLLQGACGFAGVIGAAGELAGSCAVSWLGGWLELVAGRPEFLMLVTCCENKKRAP